MMLIAEKWAKDEDVILAHQAESLLAALKNDGVFQELFCSDDGNDGDQEKVEEEPPQVRCPCGDILQLVPAKDCYGTQSYTFLYCDYCREKVDWGMDPMRMVYHCGKKKGVHPHGFDLCIVCAKRKLA